MVNDDAMRAAGFTMYATFAGSPAWSTMVVRGAAETWWSVIATDAGEDAPPLRRFGVSWRPTGSLGEYRERWTACGHDLPRLAASVAGTLAAGGAP